jgi:hypothetical protein
VLLQSARSILLAHSKQPHRGQDLDHLVIVCEVLLVRSGSSTGVGNSRQRLVYRLLGMSWDRYQGSNLWSDRLVVRNQSISLVIRESSQPIYQLGFHKSNVSYTHSSSKMLHHQL